MFESVHRLGSRIRHTPLLDRRTWLWDGVEPLWESAFRTAARRGFRTHVNDDVFRLEYSHGSRHDRRDHQAYEPIVYRALLEEIREGMIVCDVGAHIGLMTLAAAKRVGPRGHVFAFEPAPEALASLRRHVALNGFGDRVEVVPAAVGDTGAATVSFYVYHDSMSASLGRDNLDRLSPQRASDSAMKAVEITTPAVTLDGFCAGRGVEPDVLKIDVEGAELLVLRGARALLLRKPIVILCEIHPLQMQNCRSSVRELELFLAEVGYRLERLDEPGPQGIFHSRITRQNTHQ